MKNLPQSSSALPVRTLACTALVWVLGAAALHHATMGFRVISTEDGRRLAIAEQPLRLPQAQIRMPERSSLDAALASDGRVAIVAFIYTSCNAVCSILGSEFKQMQDAILARGLQRQVRLVSISFDPRDTPERLRAYGLRQAAQPAVWRFAAVDDARERTRLLEAFGIVVLPAPLGEFQHNAAFHLVSPDGRLMRIEDVEQPDQALERAIALAGAQRSGT